MLDELNLDCLCADGVEVGTDSVMQVSSDEPVLTQIYWTVMVEWTNHRRLSDFEGAAYWLPCSLLIDSDNERQNICLNGVHIPVDHMEGYMPD